MNTTATASSADKKPKRLSDEQILARVNAKVTTLTPYLNSKIGKENEKVLRYYEQQEPKRQKEGNSSYVSSDVYDSVESMKAQLLETFGGGYKIVRFDPYGEQDSEQANVATCYTEKVIFKKNRGWFVFHDAIDTALKSRNAVAEVYWEDKKVKDEHSFKRMALADVQALAAQDDVEIDAKLSPFLAIDNGPVYDGTWSRTLDKGQVRIEVIAPEEFFVEKRVKHRTDGARGKRTLTTRQDLIDEGYDEKKVKLCNVSDTDTLNLSQEAQARNAATDDGAAFKDAEVQPELEPIMLFETYIDLVLEGRKALYRVVHTDNVLFELDEVDEDPYVEFVPLRRAHAWWGNNYAAKSIPTQNARTVLTRGVLDHTAQTISPRWQVLNGAVQTPRELLDGRNGGIVNVKMRDGIAPLQYPNLNPFVFQTLEMLKQNKEETTGISALSQGLNKDAISTQNSQGLVGDLVALSQVRQKVVARNFAMFVLELWEKVYKCIVENDSLDRIEQVYGKPVQINPADWRKEREVTLSLHLGYGEQEKRAAKLKEVYAGLAQDPVMAPAFSLPKRIKLAQDAMDEDGIKNVDDYLDANAQPPGPDPIEMKKLEIEGMKAQAALITAQAAQAKVEKDAVLGEMKHQLAQLQEHFDALMQERDADRKDLDVANRVDVAQREIKLAEEAPEATAKENVIVSPNG
jgi:hypothetical protein